MEYLNNSITKMMNNFDILQAVSSDKEKMREFYHEIKNNYPGIDFVKNVEFKYIEETCHSGFYMVASIMGVVRRFYITREYDRIVLEFENLNEKIMVRSVIYDDSKYGAEIIDMLNRTLITNKFDFITSCIYSILENIGCF